jgi:hypothetical protein
MQPSCLRLLGVYVAASLAGLLVDRSCRLRKAWRSGSATPGLLRKVRSCAGYHGSTLSGLARGSRDWRRQALVHAAGAGPFLRVARQARHRLRASPSSGSRPASRAARRSCMRSRIYARYDDRRVIILGSFRLGLSEREPKWGGGKRRAARHPKRPPTRPGEQAKTMARGVLGRRAAVPAGEHQAWEKTVAREDNRREQILRR